MSGKDDDCKPDSRASLESDSSADENEDMDFESGSAKKKADALIDLDAPPKSPSFLRRLQESLPQSWWEMETRALKKR